MKIDDHVEQIPYSVTGGNEYSRNWREFELLFFLVYGFVDPERDFDVESIILGAEQGRRRHLDTQGIGTRGPNLAA
jgi:hypothetical protein